MTKKLHYSEEKFLDYYYRREAAEEGFGEHLLSCSICDDYYRKLERSLDEIKSVFQEGQETDWGAQRGRIMARVRESERPPLAIPWRKLAPMAAAVLIAVGLIFSWNPGEERHLKDAYYIKLSHNDELLINEVQDLMNKPLSESLETINFWMDYAEQGDQSSLPRLPVRSAKL